MVKSVLGWLNAFLSQGLLNALSASFKTSGLSVDVVDPLSPIWFALMVILVDLYVTTLGLIRWASWRIRLQGLVHATTRLYQVSKFASRVQTFIPSNKKVKVITKYFRNLITPYSWYNIQSVT